MVLSIREPSVQIPLTTASKDKSCFVDGSELDVMSSCLVTIGDVAHHDVDLDEPALTPPPLQLLHVICQQNSKFPASFLKKYPPE